MSAEYIVVLVTAPGEDEGEKIARMIVEERLAACVNVLPGVKSCFWWEGKVDEAKEVLLIIKTERRLFDRLQQAVKGAHSYSVPEIIALPVVAGNADYLGWIRDSVKISGTGLDKDLT